MYSIRYDTIQCGTVKEHAFPLHSFIDICRALTSESTKKLLQCLTT